MKFTVFIPILLFLLFLGVVRAEQEDFSLTEVGLLDILEESPESDKIKVEKLSTEVTYRTSDDVFSWGLDGKAAVQESTERFLGTFPTTKASSIELGINKAFSYGVKFGVGYSQQQSSNASLTNAATSKLVGQVSVDLFKDFLGRTSHSNLKEVRLGYKAGKLLEKIKNKSLRLKVRGLYWQYISSAESRDVAKELLVSAEKQLAVARKKRRSDIADAGDIARFSSQVSERNAQILQFEGAMKKTEVKFKEIFPSLSKKILKLMPYSKEKTMKSFFQCLSMIESQPETPKSYSLFDDLIELKREQFGYERKALHAYADIDIKLDAQVGIVGTGFGVSAARDNLSDNDFQSIGLSISVPLDGKKKSSEKVQLMLAQAKFDAEVRALSAQLDSSHSTIIDAAKLIKGVVENRVKNSGFLKEALKSSRKKYRQARITSQQLLQEEDKYLSNAIQLIDTERAILQLMFDYFTLFTETPCELNKVI